MAAYNITITVDPVSGNFLFNPSSLRVVRGDVITFHCPTGSFEAVFKGRSPGDKLYLSNLQPTLNIITTAPLGTFHYAVAVAVPGSIPRVFIDADCGQINVQM